MTIEQYGSIGELVGAIATLATLIYLALQVRQNSSLMSASLASAQREAGNSIALLLASDRDALQVFWAGSESRSSLEGVERQQFDAIVQILFHNWAEAFSNDEKTGLAAIHYALAEWPGMREWWVQYRRQYAEDGFGAYVDRRCGPLPNKALQRTPPEPAWAFWRLAARATFRANSLSGPRS